jgi:hypothetical protein
MGVHLDRLAGRTPLPAGVAILADQLLLLGVHADHRVPARLVGLGVVVEVSELRIPVRVLGALDRLGVALQAETLLSQQVTDGVGRDLVPGPGQLLGQRPSRFRRPPQRRHRVPAHVRLDQRHQGRAQT